MDLDVLVPGLSVGHVDLPGRQLRWLTTGQGDPPILFIAGAGGTALDWLPVLPSASALSTVVAVDRAGLGLSDPAPDLSVHSQVDDLAAVVAAIGPAVLVGHSWGGLLAQLVSWRYPASVAGLVLVDPTHEELFAELPGFLRLASAALGPATMLAHMVGQFSRLARPMARRLAARSSDDPRGRAAVEDAYLAAYRRRDQVRMIGRENRLGERSLRLLRQARAEANPVNVPAVVLISTSGKPPALQRRSAELLGEMAAALPHGRPIVVEGSGHYIHHDRPDAVVAGIETVCASARSERWRAPQSRAGGGCASARSER
jgi:pimeloyl-ACP methyl ester carboxylesterase